MFEAKIGSAQGERDGERHHLGLGKLSCGDQGLLLAALALEPPVDLVEHDGRSRHLRQVGEMGGIGFGERSVGKELEPSGGIDDLQDRSCFSRKPSVFNPLTNPRSVAKGRSGIKVMTPLLAITWSTCPTASGTSLRISLGITTWNLGEMVV